MPRQARPGDERGRRALRDRALLREPEPRADLGHSHQRHRQQAGRLVGKAGVVADDVRDHRRALGGDPVDALADGRLVGQVGLEDEAEGAGVAGDVGEEDVHRRLDALAVVVRRLQGRPAVVDDQRRTRCPAAPGRARACPGSAGRAPAWRRRHARRCRPSRRRGSPAARRPRAPTRAAGRDAACAAAARRAGAAPPRCDGPLTFGSPWRGASAVARMLLVRRPSATALGRRRRRG